MNQNLKSGLMALLSGTVATVLTGVFLLTISLDMRLMSVCLLITSYLAAYWMGKQSYTHAFIYSVCCVLPFIVFLKLVILSDLPSLWFLAPAMGLVSALGVFMGRSESKMKRVSIVTGTLLTITLIVFYIPTVISADLTQTTDKAVESFSFLNMEGEKVSSNELEGRVVVLDFYGTWCKPCIAELPELARVRDHFKANKDVQFYIVNSDQGGDTLEKAEKFIERFGNGFDFGYDHDRRAYQAIGLKGFGVPSLVVLDKQGKVRLRHVGYNKAETDFVENMIHQITGILETD